MASAPVPQSYLDVTPSGLTQAEIDAFRTDKNMILIYEIGGTPPDNPGDPNPLTTTQAFRRNRSAVLAHLLAGTQAMRAAMATAATTAGQSGNPVGTGAGSAGPSQSIPGVEGGAEGTVPLVAPRCGGISNNFGVPMVWTGGGRVATTKIDEPKSILAYRPEDFKQLANVVKECQTGLSDDHRWGLPHEIFKEASGISFRLWNDKVKTELEDRGMDGEFHLVTHGIETYLLDEYGKTNLDSVVEWIDKLRGINPPCRYEEQNMKMSAKFLLGSIKVDLLMLVKHNTRENASGPEVYTAIVNLHQYISTSAVRKLVDTLDKMSLQNEPGEDVPKFAGKVTDIAKRIIGTGFPPSDLVALIYKAFTKCSVESFRITANLYFERADEEDPIYNNWETWILKLQLRYQRDCDNGKWEPIKHHKESAAVTGPVPGDGDTRTCYHCGKRGHIKPDKDKPSVRGTSSGQGRSSNRTAPGNGARHTKTVDGITYSWCGICKRWNSGKKAHLTAEHKVRTKSDKVSTVVPVAPVANSSETTPAANVATDAAAPYSLESNLPVYIMSGFGAIQETHSPC